MGNRITQGTKLPTPDRDFGVPAEQYGHEGMRGRLIRMGQVQPPHQDLASQIMRMARNGQGGGNGLIRSR